MKCKLRAEYSYNGMFLDKVKDYPSDEQREVELLGVPTPVDPGFVRIKDRDEERNVPTLSLSGIHKIDFGSLLADWQEKERGRCGFLFGSGSKPDGVEPGLIPIEEIVEAA